MNTCRIFLLLAISATSSCSLYPFGGEGKNGQYFGMSGGTQGMVQGSCYVPKNVQRQEPLF